jgi:hypothetical protein
MPPGDPMDLVIVRRGDEQTFQLFQKTATAQGDIKVIWDRRVGERRLDPRISNVPPAQPDRRRRDRRVDPSPTWTEANFVAVRSASSNPG